MEIVVETKSDVIGNGVFWRGPADRINEIRNIPARKTAELVAKDGKSRVCGMWHVSTVPNAEFSGARAAGDDNQGRRQASAATPG